MRRLLMLLAGVAAGLLAFAAVAGRRRAAGDGGRMADARGYDMGAALVLAPVYARIAREVAREAPAGADVLDIGCGPGQLALRVAQAHGGLTVTGADIDPAMIARAVANRDRRGLAGGAGTDDPGQPTFVVGDVAALPFPDASFDLAVSTFSMHHWEDPAAGLAELHRILRPGGRALIWDVTGPLRHGVRHAERSADPLELAAGSPFGTARIGDRWGIGPITLVARYDLERSDGLASP
jgi:SAM-dependent methyltransferase